MMYKDKNMKNELRNGYYLSMYLACNKMAHDFDISLRHDQNMALWHKQGDNIQLVHYWELERYTRHKQHYYAFESILDAKACINELLSQYDLSLDDMVAVMGTPELATVDITEYMDWVGDYSYHSLFHLYSSMLMDTSIFYDEKVIGIAVDGGPDCVLECGKEIEKYNYYVGGIAEKGKVDLFSVKSPGLLWLMIVIKLKKREGTLMALASASESALCDDKFEIPKLDNPNSIDEVTVYVDELYDKISKLTIDDAGKLFNYFDTRFTMEENLMSMFMKVIQRKSIEIMEENMDTIIHKYKIDTSEYYLAIGGGYALNCPTNSTLLNKYNFKGLLIPPCTNDAGQAMGIGLSYFYMTMQRFHYKFDTPFLGHAETFDVDAVRSIFPHIDFEISDFNEDTVIEDILQGPIVWFNEKAEVGPRALGHRSLLGNPMTNKTKDAINKIKDREWWRPVAPMVLESDVNDWFETGRISPYMLCTSYVKKELKKRIPAILHLDNSARVQLVDEHRDNVMYKLLHKMKEKTGVPILCNTSLNDKGEPIINTIEQALYFAIKKGIKVVYINKARVVLNNLSAKRVERKKEGLFYSMFNSRPNADNEKKRVYTYYLNRPKLQRLCLDKKNEFEVVRRLYSMESKRNRGLSDLIER